MNDETVLRETMARADLPDHLVEEWATRLRPQLDASGRYRRTSGEYVSVPEIVQLVLDAELSKAQETADVAPQHATDAEPFLRALRARLIADRAAAASVQVPDIQGVLQRLDNGLGRIGAGR